MPTTDIYVNTGQAAGDECSSGGGGRTLTFEESVLVHPSHTDGLVDGGDPVVIGGIVGVAQGGAAAVTDLIAVDTEGIRWLSVVASDDDGASAVARGDDIFINTTTCVLSKISDPDTQLPFGKALGVLASGTGVVAIKVHSLIGSLLASGGSAVETITASGAASVTGASQLDSSGGALAVTLADGLTPGQEKLIVMTEASNASTVTVAHTDLMDSLVATFGAIDEYLLLVWTGTEWAVQEYSCTIKETLTASGAVNPLSIPTELDSNAGALTMTLADGSHIGDHKLIVMTEASNASTVSATHHETSDPELGTFDAVDEYWLLVWTGTEWATVANTCTFV